MTQTTQPCSWAVLNKTDKGLTKNKPEMEDNEKLLLSLFDSMNNLCEKLNRLNYLIQRKELEQLLYRNNKGVIE
ncbi:MAG: hypothetical protein LBC52_04760 [Treponema sp.]|jgi:hypothetical protein|nr:hypothetical protein [Treponema sp.]